MAGEIELKVGMSFGTYTDKFNELSERKDLNCKKDYNNSVQGKDLCTFYEKNTGERKAEMLRTHHAPSKTPHVASVFCKEGDVIYEGDLITQEGGCADKFIKITTPKQYAVDLNLNGIIDEGEICDRK